MSRSLQMYCQQCGANITMSGAAVCKICDPDPRMYVRGGNLKSPQLCEKCFAEHVGDHKKRMDG